jgi:hypothetical protein
METDDSRTWRRYTRREALDFFFVLFTIAMLGGVSANLIWKGAPDIERAFYFALYFAPAMAIASLVVRLRPVVDHGPASPNDPPD